MRIVGGTCKGRPLRALEGRHTRPTTDRVREALFSALYSRLGGFEDLQVLDAFAGSGALGLEALSRGARRVVFCESDKDATAVVRRNAQECGWGSQAWELRRCDVLRSSFGDEASPFDLVFLDPPYALDPSVVMGLVEGLSSQGALAPGALVAYEHDAANAAAVEEAVKDAGFALLAQKKYGKCMVTMMEAIS